MCTKIRCDEESWKFLTTKQDLNASTSPLSPVSSSRRPHSLRCHRVVVHGGWLLAYLPKFHGRTLPCGSVAPLVRNRDALSADSSRPPTTPGLWGPPRTMSWAPVLSCLLIDDGRCCRKKKKGWTVLVALGIFMFQFNGVSDWPRP